MPVLSNPSSTFHSQDQNVASSTRLAKECTSLSLADRGIEQLCGFEDFYNLSVLVLSRNRLTKIDQLDSNFRIRVLIAQSNQICTLKGSLVHMKFLQELDLSHNLIRNLQKVKRFLERFEFLETLNLIGNPCCEEADYRPTLIDAIGSLVTLDCHAVTSSERKQATACLHPGPPPRIGFGSTVPPPPSDSTPIQRESFHERKAYQEMKAILERSAEKERARGLPPMTVTMPHCPPPLPSGHLGGTSESSAIQPSVQTTKAEACLRRDVYQFSSVMKPVHSCTDMQESTAAQTIALDPAAYKLLQKTLFYVLVSSWIEEKDQCARSERASDQSELGIGLFAEYVSVVVYSTNSMGDKLLSLKLKADNLLGHWKQVVHICALDGPCWCHCFIQYVRSMVEHLGAQQGPCNSFEQFISLVRNCDGRNHIGRSNKELTASGTTPDEALQACFAQLVLSKPSEVMGKPFEWGWRVLFYKIINTLRGVDRTGTDEQLAQTCVRASLFYKGLLLQLQQKYDVLLPMHIELDEAGREAIAMHVATITVDEEASRDDVMAVVSNCLVKLGDCTRYLLDAKYKVSASKEGMRLATGYYLAAQRAFPGHGQVYNQIGALMELWDGSGNNVCLGACMNFALASTALQVGSTASTNWLRCIGMHRNALQVFSKDNNLQAIASNSMCALYFQVCSTGLHTLQIIVLQHVFGATKAVLCRKFTMMINVLSMTIVPLFGTGVDTVDLDKCDMLWEVVQGVLKQLLHHKSWLRSCVVRRPDEDVVMQAACHSCVCLWHAHQETMSASDQVDSMRRHTVFSQLAKAQIQMATTFTSGLSDMLLRDASGSEDCSTVEPSLASRCATARCLWSLMLVLYTLEVCVADHVIVQQSEHITALVAACIELPCRLAGSDILQYSTAPVEEAVLGCSFVRGSKVFAGLYSGSDKLCSQEVKMLHSSALAYARVLGKLADRLCSVSWHAGTVSAGSCFQGVSQAIQQWVESCRSEGEHAPVPTSSEIAVEDGSHGDTEEEQEEIFLLPGLQ